MSNRSTSAQARDARTGGAGLAPVSETAVRVLVRVLIAAALFGLVALPAVAVAQEKTAKACRQEWQANKADFQAKGVTEKAYVAQCRAGNPAAEPTARPATANPPPAAAAAALAKTAKACREEWRANKAAFQSAGVSEKAYVEKCRAGETIAAPGAAPASQPPAPAAAAPAQAPPPQVKPAARTAAPTGSAQFATESQAKSHCPGDTVVWANLSSKVYHFAGYKNYGDTKHGAYMCERDATAQGLRAAKREKRPGA